MNLTQEQIEWIEREVYSIAPIQPREDQFCAKRRAAISQWRETVRKHVTEKLLKTIAMSMITLRGVNLDPETPAIKNAKSPEDLKAQGFFSHLSPENEDEAVLELFELIKPGVKVDPEEE